MPEVTDVTAPPEGSGSRPSVMRRAARAVLRPGEKLGRRVMHAAGWNFALRVALRGSVLVRTVILARLLAPQDFGVMGVAFLALELLQNFTTTGFSQALVQREGSIRRHLDTAWTIELIRNLLLGAVLWAGAPAVAAFFDEPLARPVVQVMGLGLAIAGLDNIGKVYFERDLEFHRIFILQVSGVLANLAVAIPAAVILRSVWALMLGYLAQNLATALASYLVHPYRPRLRLDGVRAREMFDFGKWVLGSDTVIYLLNNVDYMIVGRFLGAVSLGYYRLAFNFSQLSATEITNVVGKVAFPAYSKLQDQRDRLRGAYLRSLRVIAAAVFPASIGTVLIAPLLVDVFLGARWQPVTLPLQLLTVAGLTRSLAATTGPLFRAVGRPAIVAHLAFARLVLLVPALLLVTPRWGIVGAAVTVVGSSLAVHGFSVGLGFREVGLRSDGWLPALAFPVAHTAVMSVAVLLTMHGLAAAPDVLALVATVAVGVATYLLGAVLSLRHLGYDEGGILPTPLRARIVADAPSGASRD